MSDDNPFRPGFGKQPPFMAGRERLTRRFWAAADAGPKDNDYAMVLTGIRGCGKTAFMGSVRDAARQRGWGIIRATATGDGSLDGAIRERVMQPDARPRNILGLNRWTPRLSRPLRRSGRRLRGVQVAGFGAEWDATSQVALSEALRHLGRKAAKRRRGILLTVDEMHQATEMEGRRLAVCMQEIAEEELPIAFLGAGLPELTDAVDDHEGMTFFQRCGRASVGLLSPDDARRALADPIRQSGKAINEDALDDAVGYALGYPFKLQLVGYHAWVSAGDGSRITRGIVHGAAHEANRAMLTQIVLPIWTHLPREQQDILESMSEDDGDSRAEEVANRTGASEDEVRHHFKRLEIVGAVERLSADRCQFLHPLMREWIRGGASEVMDIGDRGTRRVFPLDREPLQPSKSAKQRILEAHSKSPKASNAELARRTASSRSYVGKVLRKAGRR